ncbi:hypothetical protein CBM2587_B10102 [Cupriavidus taiwanensis]|uniref:Uncharacterized protein n=1 Tax=Cupriavidus taiwanensis TaxID=164546 RepID=A0A975X499_9BURK|nr:hypothetical protein CBM2587_B10102 [Cupriavidus taiwanensis]
MMLGGACSRAVGCRLILKVLVLRVAERPRPASQACYGHSNAVSEGED